MNILFFLTPKSEVAYLYEDYSLRQALEKMEHHRYSAVPSINQRKLCWYNHRRGHVMECERQISIRFT